MLVPVEERVEIVETDEVMGEAGVFQATEVVGFEGEDAEDGGLEKVLEAGKEVETIEGEVGGLVVVKFVEERVGAAAAASAAAA